MGPFVFRAQGLVLFFFRVWGFFVFWVWGVPGIGIRGLCLGLELITKDSGVWGLGWGV